MEATSNSQLETDQISAPADDQDAIFNEMLEVMSALQSNPFDFALHQRNVAVCRKLGAATIEELSQARNLMSEYFPVRDDFFLEWINDLMASQEDPYDPNSVEAVLELYQQASSYAFFPTIESARLQYVIGLYYHARGLEQPTGDLATLMEESINETKMEEDSVNGVKTAEQSPLKDLLTDDKVREVAVDVLDKMGYHLVESSKIWNAWALYEFDTLQKDWGSDAIARFKLFLQSRLRVPHLESDQTFQLYSNFITKHENESYEEEMVAVNELYSPARQQKQDREVHESQLRKSIYSAEAYIKYLAWETTTKNTNFNLVSTLFERAIHDHPNSVEIWGEYFRYLDPSWAICAARRAIRTTPWSGEIWEAAIRTFMNQERNGQTAESVEELCDKAINSKFLEQDVEAIVAFSIGRADFHRRRLDAYLAAGGVDNVEQVDALMQATVKALNYGIDHVKKVPNQFGDPACRLEKYLTALLEHHGREDDAAKVWQKATKQYRESYSIWISAADYEIRRGDLKRAREYYKKAANSKLDYPEYLLQAWITFEHHYGSLEDLEYAVTKTNNLMKGIAARRKRELEQQSGLLQQTSDQSRPIEISETKDLPKASAEVDTEVKKRKAEAADDIPNGGEEKRARFDSAPARNVEGEELKRDRENSTVLVGCLPSNVTEANIKQLFRDVGIDADNTVATVEFMEKESVLPAQTKDKKQLLDVEVSVTLAWRSTLYVTNFPEDATDEWIRSKFGEFGKIFDVRWPSKRFKSTRRFCYVQFTSPDSAQSALALHNTEVAPSQKMSVFISDPLRKKARTDVGANDRELYITCLTKFVQEADLRKLFQPFGDIKGVRMILNEDGHSKGFAFVEFETEASAKAALSMNNVELKKRRIGVTISNSKGTSLVGKNKGKFQAESKLSSAVDQRSRCVKVSKLPEGVQEAIVQQAFESFGKVLKTITYPEKQEAVVEFANAQHAGAVFLHPEAILINGQQVELSVPSSSVKAGSSTVNSNLPLLPRTTTRGKKARLGLGFSGASSGSKPLPGDKPLKETSSHVAPQVSQKPGNSATSGPIGKSQDDFRKMLG
ncbi:uncharacterized protein MELLADRAFT_91734 [Melampsora larici-populina 98AG31]|uniref:U4/U6 snRNA-associated-splicing factor PRP24 n=1 Tax=Melampsora larici-populina (strain 98AG31 / pathotype 3-4-7) TaxID=747676 RepID=F4S041_MELLP|nr:uncharacterized protein MELLADRAFT_91734 [Melampsora larici-populina 98AG31]EGG01898.1 hypothetical protein MELLADRAFT_91734 [Melampsora larici-populina 98AG31]